MSKSTKPKIAILQEVKQEANNVLSFVFEYPNLQSQPGQFVMLWLPGVDQKPFSIASDDGTTFGCAVFKIKHFTEELFSLKVGAKVGVSGPFGNPYTIAPDSNVIAVGGGYGSAPLAYLIAEAQKKNCGYELLIGARNKDLLLYPSKFPEYTHLATNDGSAGHKGYVTELLQERLELLDDATKSKTSVYVCGPEPMEYAAAKLCQSLGVASQISVERFMKCGFGVCGQCCVDDTGETMCQVGPVVSGDYALNLAEFGKYHRDKSGAKQSY